MAFIQVKKVDGVWQATAHFDEPCEVDVFGTKKVFWHFKAEGLDEEQAIQNVKEYCRKKGAVMREPVEIKPC